MFREIADESNNNYFLAFQELLGDRVSIESENWHGRKPFNIGNDHFVTPNYRTTSVRMCPFCLKQYGIHFIVWELHCITACPFHRCGLLENCAKCGSRFTWLSIYPCWRCQCGMEITAMGLKKANPRSINLANLLVKASDVVLPLGAECPQSETDNEPYTLYEVLNAIDKGSIIARSVFKPDKPFDKSLKNEPNTNRHPLTVVAWVAQILTDSDEITIRRMVRVWADRYKDKDTMLELNQADDIFLKIRKCLSKINGNRLLAKIDSSIVRLINNHQIALPIGLTVHINPRYNMKRFDNPFLQFAGWWGKLLDNIVTLQPDAIYAKRNYIPQKHDPFIFEILNTLLDSAQKGIDPDAFRYFTKRWQVTEELKMHPKCEIDLLHQICEYLISLPYFELYYIYSLTCYCLKKFETENLELG
jgi:hypothetical protein